MLLSFRVLEVLKTNPFCPFNMNRFHLPGLLLIYRECIIGCCSSRGQISLVRRLGGHGKENVSLLA